MQKERVMLRAAGGIPYELTRGRVKRLNLHVRRDGTVALSIPLRTTLEAADAYVIAEAEWIRAAQARQAAREKRQEELPDKAAALGDEDVKQAAADVEKALGSDGRLLLRQSGTEPLIRVMVEAESTEICEKYVDQVIGALRKKGHAVS